MHLLKFLNNHYPVLLSKWKTVLFISLFISVFLCVFQPFGLQFVRIEHKTTVLAGYGFVTFILLMINLYLLPVIFIKYFNPERWTVGKQILWVSWIIFSISVGNYAYSIAYSIIPWSGAEGLLSFIVFTLSIAILPITAITLLTRNIYLKRNLAISNRINKAIKHSEKNKQEKKEIQLSSGNRSYSFPAEAIVFLESDGNYIKVHFLDKDTLRTQLIRNTMKRVCAGIPCGDIFRCHRAFAVNIKYVEHVSGNSHGISVTLTHTGQIIPVSRNNTKAFISVLESSTSVGR